MVLFVLQYSVILTFSSVDETMQCDHPLKATEQYCTVVLFVFTIQCGSNFFICGSTHVV